MVAIVLWIVGIAAVTAAVLLIRRSGERSKDASRGHQGSAWWGGGSSYDGGFSGGDGGGCGDGGGGGC